ncbi:MAG: DinB family protein [Chitinophagales bacterium]|nr:DinB family protein [Chitinophagales bacterium]
MSENFNLSHCIQILSHSPMVIKELLCDLDLSWTNTNEGEESWSPSQILAHLIYGEKTDWIPRARIILNGGGVFDAFDRFAHLDMNRSVDLLLIEFEELRSVNIDTLQSWDLSPDELRLKGNHPDFGPVTLQELIATWTVHDLVHINQMTRVMAKYYKDEIGPFKNYISLLKSVD